MKVKYLGEKAPRTFPLPLPLMSLASKTGELCFEATGNVQEIDDAQARSMCEAFPELFELVSEKTEKKSSKSAD